MLCLRKGEEVSFVESLAFRHLCTDQCLCMYIYDFLQGEKDFGKKTVIMQKQEQKEYL